VTGTRIVLIRHGESQCNVNGIVGGHVGCTGLTECGFEQARKLRDRLASTGELAAADVFYTSLLPRAIQTAETIAPAVGGGRLEAVRRCSLCELHPGLSDGLEWPVFEDRYGNAPWQDDPTIEMAPQGESWSGFVDRASSAVAALTDEHPGSLIVVVCHGGIVRATMATFLPLVDRYASLRLPTAYTSITEWEHDDRGWQLVRYNDVEHLGGPFESMKDGPHVVRR
jgi:2,3-bisphosphoglycerate-dependent phosphoglycerate mutase